MRRSKSAPTTLSTFGVIIFNLVNYQPEDFKQCRFNPLDKDLFTTYPQLKDFHTVDLKRLRLVIALYDPKSPLIRDYTDLGLRKQYAATLVGYSLDDKELPALFDFTDPDFASTVNIFLKEFVSSRLWAMIVSNEQMFWEFNERLRKKVKGQDDKAELQAVDVQRKLAESLDEINVRLEAYYDKFYHGDSLLQEAAKKKRVTPENIGLNNKI